MSYKIIEQTDQGKLIEIEIDGKKHQTFAVCQRDNMEDANLDDVVEAFRQSIINPPTITPLISFPPAPKFLLLAVRLPKDVPSPNDGNVINSILFDSGILPPAINPRVDDEQPAFK